MSTHYNVHMSVAGMPAFDARLWQMRFKHHTTLPKI